MNITDALKYFLNPMPSNKPVQHDDHGPLLVKDIIAPPAIEVDFDHLKTGERYFRTLFVAGYPRFVSANWLEPLISFDHTLDIAMYVYPTQSAEVMENLRRKIGEMEATIQSDMKRGRVLEPSIQVRLEDALEMQQQLAKGAERFFQFGLYVTIPAKSFEDLNKTTKQVEATLGSLLIITKKTILQMEEGFKTTLPMGQDRLVETRNMDTTALATTFPFTTSELTANEGILYGINEHNDSLIIFDRFTLENANTVLFGKSVARWESVLIRQNGVVQLEKIGKLIENLIANEGITHRDGELEGVKNPNLEVFSYDEALEGRWSKVSVAGRKAFTPRELLYTITTKSGRTITVTADHSLVVLRNGRIRAIRGQAVKIGEAVPLPRNLPEPKDPPRVIHPKASVPSWPSSLPATLVLDHNLLALLGLTTSEGSLTTRVLTIYNRNPIVLDVIASATKALGGHIAPRWAYPDKQHLVGYGVQPNAYARLFCALGAGGLSGEKRVPAIIFSLSNAQVASYLRAYFEGDGTVSNQEVSCTSKSRELISDLAYLLLRFGILGRIRGKFKRATNAQHGGSIYYDLVLSGSKNVESFAEYVGFLTPDKHQKLAQILGKSPNTNVDTIPQIESTLASIYRRLYQGDEVAAPRNLPPLTRGVFSPSPTQLRVLIAEFERRVAEIKAEKEVLLRLKRLPTFITFCQKAAKKRRTNARLWKALGQSWRLMKNQRVTPGLVNVLRAYQTVYGETITIPEVKQVLYHGFKTFGISLRQHNPSLWTAIVEREYGDTAYANIEGAIQTLWKKHRSLHATLIHVKRKIAYLKRLADSDLFWDPIVKIEKVKHSEQYVYDLTVDNQVFLAGAGGVFVHNSGSGKSYMVKLEIMRSLMFDTDVIVIDPENEYEALTHALGGEYIRFSFGAATKINPFDLTLLRHKGEESELNQKVLSLHGFFRVVMGTLTATEDALLDRALILTYKQKGITPDITTQSLEAPLMEDLYKALIGMEEPLARGLADRIEKFVKGSLVGIFDQQTNIEIRNPLTVFSIRDLEEELRPIAMYLILDFIWTKVRRDTKRRILVVDEAWYMMKHPDSAQFLNSIAKRARKYYLGLTTITQDVEDFLSVDLGKTIIQNSSMQVLMKQSSAAIDKVAEVFYLSEGEKHLLLSADIGEGLFFAGPAHAAIRIIASLQEHELVTTKPQELEAKKRGPASVLPSNQFGATSQAIGNRQEVKQPVVSPSSPGQSPHSAPASRPIFTVETVPSPPQTPK